MIATLDPKGNLVITIPANTTNPPSSSTGKTRIVASTGGGTSTPLMVNGKPVTINLTAWIKA